MLIIFSHVLAFSVLFIAAVWDLYTTDVPDILGFVGVLGGLSLHALYSYLTGSWDPLIWSLSAGLIFSVFGWGMYILGLWGGADAFAMSVLGFAAPFAVSGTTAGIGWMHGANLFLNIMIVGFVYSLVFAFYKAFRSESVFRKTIDRIMGDEKRVSIEILAAGGLSFIGYLAGLNGFLYFLSILMLIFLFRFLKVLEEEEMVFEKDIVDLEPGDVVSISELDIGIARDKNLFGEFIERCKKGFESRNISILVERLDNLEKRMGYPEVVGITAEEIELLKDNGVESVEVKTGTRFIPVFPIALVITSAYGGGLMLLIQMF